MLDLKDHIRTIPDFPKPGVQFRDITTLIAHGGAFEASVARLADIARGADADLVVGLEARGFIFGGAVAARLGLGFAPLRKRGKLPGTTVSQPYTLEYGEEVLEAHDDLGRHGSRAVIIDDLVATGGTLIAAMTLLRRLDVAPMLAAAVIDLPDLGGAEKVRAAGLPVEVLVSFEGH